MPAAAPVFAAIGGAFSAAATGTAAVLGGTALGGGVGGALLAGFTKVALGVALSAAARALLPTQEIRSTAGAKVSVEFGEDVPASMIFGTFATPGHLLYANSWGDENDTPNEHYVLVYELADFPARLKRVWVNGEWATLGATLDEAGRGYPVEGYEDDGYSRLHIKFYDGTQTVADPYLRAKFGSDEDMPWTSDMIGLGLPIAIVTVGYRPEVHRKFPEFTFEAEAWGHYDRRKDSSAGGFGPQRWSDWRTWEPSDNLVVHIDNIMRGIHDPITGEFIWGGQNIGNRELPSSAFFAAANECDLDSPLAGGGVEPQYRTGLEASFDRSPAEIIESLLAGGNAIMGEMAGEWSIRVGAPTPAVYAFSDADIVISTPDTYDPFPGLNDAYNGISGQYPEPIQGWAAKSAPDRLSDEYLLEDGGRSNIAAINYSAVPYATQVQRLMQASLDDARRFRRHTLVLPSEAVKLGLADTLSWTSERNGYISKLFETDLIEDLQDGNVLLALREVDPNDYSWGTDKEFPTTIDVPVRPRRGPNTPLFAVEPWSIKDPSAKHRRPAIKLTWAWVSGTTGVRYQIRLAGGDEIPGDSRSSMPSRESESAVLTLNGSPVTLNGEVVTFFTVANFAQGFAIINGSWMLPSTDYEVRAMFEPITGRKWSSWLPVTTPNVKLGEEDFADEVRDKIDTAAETADAAGDAAQQAYDKALEVEQVVANLNEETLAHIDDIIASLEGIDIGTIQELRGIALAGLKRGWVKDPTFAEWSGTVPTYWITQFYSYGSKALDGHYGTALLIDAPATSARIEVSAASDETGQIPAADPKAEYVVAAALIKCMTGDLTGSQIRVQWRAAGSSTWVSGHAFGVQNATGSLTSQWGFAIAPTRTQSREIIWQAPMADAEAIRILLVAKQNTSDPARKIRVDYLDVRAASEAEVDAYLANGYADAQIDALELTITGPGGAIAASQDTLRAEFGAADASINSTLLTVANDVSSLASDITTLEASYGDNNFVKNTDFSDGARPAGQAPAWWSGWGSDFSVIARGSSAADAVQNAPTLYVGQITAGAAFTQAMAHGPVPVSDDDLISIGFQAAGTGSGISVTLRARLQWYAADRVTLVGVGGGGTFTVVGTGWASVDFGEIVPPAGAAYFDYRVQRLPGGTLNNILFTNVYSRKSDKVSYAKATQALVAAADAESAIAAWRTRVEASFDDYDDFIAYTQATAVAASNAESSIGTWETQVGATFGSYTSLLTATQSAVASADLAATAYVIRATAGGGDAAFKIVAWDDETGVGDAIILDADNIIAPGTLSTNSLVLTDLGRNIVQDNQLQSASAWGGSGSGFSIIKTTTSTAAESTGEMRWNYSSGTDTVDSRGAEFSVIPGDRLFCSFQVAATGGGAQFSAVGSVYFVGKDGSYVDVKGVATVTRTGTNVTKHEGVVLVPAGAFKARWRWAVIKSATTTGVRFFAPSAIRQTDGNILITPESITGALLVTTDELISNSAQIGSLTVGTIQIKDHAVTDPYSALNDSSQYFDSGVINDWTTVQTLAVQKAFDSPIELVASCELQSADVVASRTATLRIIRLSSTGFTILGSTFSSFGSDTWSQGTIRALDLSSYVGTRTYALQVTVSTSAPDTRVRNAYIHAFQPVVPKK